MTARATAARQGRPSVTSRVDLERAALDVFNRRGFEATTVEDIATAAGVSRRTFFRYYRSKNDVVWGDFEALLEALASWLDAAPQAEPLLEAITRAVVRFNALPSDAVPAHRQRMALILHTPALQAHSTLRYAAWREVIARFAAGRLGAPAGSLDPQLVGHLALGAALAAYEQWLGDERTDLTSLLRAAFASLELRLPRD